MTRIIIEAIPPGKMRLEAYRSEGCGDWYYSRENGDLHIKVAFDTDILDDDEAFLLAIHELSEAFLCFRAGITEGMVDAFDMAFTGEGEPGDDPAAPYRKQHRAACLLEHTLALLMGRFDHGSIE